MWTNVLKCFPIVWGTRWEEIREQGRERSIKVWKLSILKCKREINLMPTKAKVSFPSACLLFWNPERFLRWWEWVAQLIRLAKWANIWRETIYCWQEIQCVQSKVYTRYELNGKEEILLESPRIFSGRRIEIIDSFRSYFRWTSSEYWTGGGRFPFDRIHATKPRLPNITLNIHMSSSHKE